MGIESETHYVTYISHFNFSTHNTTYNLSVSNVIEDGLERLSLEHHVLDEVHIEVVEVHLANGVSKLVLECVNLVLQSPHLPEERTVLSLCGERSTNCESSFMFPDHLFGFN